MGIVGYVTDVCVLFCFKPALARPLETPELVEFRGVCGLSNNLALDLKAGPWTPLNNRGAGVGDTFRTGY